MNICYFCGDYATADKARFVSKMAGKVDVHGACTVKYYNPNGHVPLAFPKKIDYSPSQLAHPPNISLKDAFLL